MAEEIAFENGRISNFEGLVTWTLTLDWVILHTVTAVNCTMTLKCIVCTYSTLMNTVSFTTTTTTTTTVVHHSSTSTYMSNFIEIEKSFCGRTDGRTHARMYVRTYVRTHAQMIEKST